MNESFTLTVSEQEREFLFEILEERQRMLLREIDHTDHHDFKLALQKKERLLESMMERFAAHA